MSSIYGRRMASAYPKPALPAGIDPNGPYVMQWWTPAHDQWLRETIEKYQSPWFWHVSDALIAITPENALANWRASDPICKRWAWQNALMYFAVARAEHLGLSALIRPVATKKCLICEQSFLENSIPEPLLATVGFGEIEFCSPCLAESFFNRGNFGATADEIKTYLRDLTVALGYPPPSAFGTRRGDLENMPTWQRLVVLDLLRRKPALQRVRELFGTWKNALLESASSG
ncbi:MAG: hypothetical protein KGL11_06400 [Alphaproteobacteria bacterium]|nr:hypothetical protein [Alphaproteobacteria bacterium]